MTILLYDLVGADPARPFSPHCWKARMALRHKGLDFTSVPVAFTGVPSIEGGASKTVPLMRDGSRLVADSFAIAEDLEARYPDRPSLFAGEGGRALSRFVESWSLRVVHPAVLRLALLDIHDGLAPADRAYFRSSREARFSATLESYHEPSPARIEALRQGLEPFRALLASRPFLGGEGPLFADYIVFGALQWLRVVSPVAALLPDDPVARWFERCLDLHGGEGRAVAARAA